MRAALAVALTLGFASTSEAPIMVPLDRTWLGVMYCEGGYASAWVRADVLLTPEGPQVVAHELQHKQDAEAFGSCEAYHAWVAEDTMWRKAVLEASAFCASARVDTRSGRLSWSNAITMYSARLAYQYPYGLSVAEAEVLIRRFCTVAPEVRS